MAAKGMGLALIKLRQPSAALAAVLDRDNRPAKP